MNIALRVFGPFSALGAYGYFNPFRLEHALALILFVGLVAFRRTRRMALTWTPALIFALAYDFLRVFDATARTKVSIGVVDELELRLFGISTPNGVVQPVEWLGERTLPWLDLIGAVFYSTHLAFAVVFGVILSWKVSKDATEAPRLYGFLWGFLLLHLSAFAIQVAWPVAPPWYAATNLGPHEVIGNAAGLLRVDALIGIDYFANVYAKSAYVFGAMPSLHVAVPVWVAIWAKGPARVFAAFVAAAMAFFAVYLGHHFILDVIAGFALAMIIGVITRAFMDHIVALQERIFEWGFHG